MQSVDDSQQVAVHERGRRLPHLTAAPQPLQTLWRMQNGYCMPESLRALQVTRFARRKPAACCCCTKWPCSALLDPAREGGQERRRMFMERCVLACERGFVHYT
jgi:hypothetical protein